MELVVLVDDSGRPVGTAEKHAVHTDHTPLHLAFSCWVLGADGRVLLTRRALGKKTWPGVWTNAFCGHPGPGEETEAAVYRRAEAELGLAPRSLASLELVLPDFRYRAVDASGTVENEICPVYLAVLAEGAGGTEGAEGAQLRPNPDEVAEYAWADPAGLIAAVDSAPFAFSPWLVEELAREPLRRRLTGAEAGT